MNGAQGPRVVLSKRNPVDGTPNPYRTRWWEHDGVVFVIESDRLDGIWIMSPDIDLLFRLADRHLWGEARLAFSSQMSAYVKGGYAGVSSFGTGGWGVAVRLADVRTQLATLVTSPAWPAIRDAYLALLAEARGNQPTTR